MMAAFMGPLILGSVWSGVTKAGAFAGLLTGGGVYIITYLGVISLVVWPWVFKGYCSLATACIAQSLFVRCDG